MRSGVQGGDLELRSPAGWQQGKLEAPGVYILQPHFEIIERFLYVCTRQDVDVQKCEW